LLLTYTISILHVAVRIEHFAVAALVILLFISLRLPEYIPGFALRISYIAVAEQV